MQENDIYYLERCKFADNLFVGLVGFHVSRIYLLQEVLYHYVVNYDSIILTKGLESHLDRLFVFQEMVEEYERRSFLADYHDFIEAQFLQLFFVNSLFNFYCRGGKVPLNIFNYMQQTVLKLFPDYKKNPLIDCFVELSAGSEVLKERFARMQLSPSVAQLPAQFWAKLTSISMLDLIEAELTELELNWWLAIYYSGV